MAGKMKSTGAKKIGRAGRRPAKARYNGEKRWLKNKARKIAKQAKKESKKAEKLAKRAAKAE